MLLLPPSEGTAASGHDITCTLLCALTFASAVGSRSRVVRAAIRSGQWLLGGPSFRELCYPLTGVAARLHDRDGIRAPICTGPLLTPQNCSCAALIMSPNLPCFRPSDRDSYLHIQNQIKVACILAFLFVLPLLVYTCGSEIETGMRGVTVRSLSYTGMRTAISRGCYRLACHLYNHVTPPTPLA